MSIPNMQQRFYLAKALNEDTDHLFDHPETLEEGSRGLARHERIVRALTKKAASLKATPQASKSSEAYHNRWMNKQRLAKGQQDRDIAQIARERGRAGLTQRIPNKTTNASHADETETWRVKSEPRSLSKGFAAARVPKAVLKYRETSKAKKAAALAAKGKQ
jgi:hypothetical protein